MRRGKSPGAAESRRATSYENDRASRYGEDSFVGHRRRIFPRDEVQ